MPGTTLLTVRKTLCHVGMNFWKLILASSWFQIGNMKWTIYQHILKLHDFQEPSTDEREEWMFLADLY